MRIIPSENDGFVLVSLDFARLNQLFLFSTNALQKDRSGFIGRILWHQFALNCFLEDGLFEQIRKLDVQIV